MARRTQVNRQLGVETPLEEDVLLLRGMLAQEAVSQLFEFELDLTSENGEVAFADLVGQPMTVRLDTADGDVRYFNGIVSRFMHMGVMSGQHQYRATLVPWLWLLTRRSDCRIFQNMTVPDIVMSVFRELGLTDFEVKLSGTYRKWEYCVQYRETDFNFVSRLLEQEGIFYFFRHESGKHTLVLADAPSAIEAFPGYEEVRFKPPDAVLAEGGFMHSWSVERHLLPGRYTHTDFDFQAPRKDLLATSKATHAEAGNSFEVFDFPGEYLTPKEGEALAAVRMDEYQGRFEVARGASDSRGLAAGFKFTLVDFPRSEVNKEYLITSTVMMCRSDEFGSGETGEGGGTIVKVTLTAIDATQTFRPPRVTPKPIIQGPQTAIVVGQSGEEIWTDEHGRVKVRFHWDRNSHGDENSSCWIRVSQPWAGKGWGAINIPRIGQEVIVEFLEGDPDRPIITGRVYNGDQKPPYELPAEATKTTFKTLTSKEGGGFNELRFEDKKDEEQIFIHAQKDLDIEVENDVHEHIKGNRHITLDKDSKEEIKLNRHITIEKSTFEKVGEDFNMTIEGKEAKKVKGSLSCTVEGDVIWAYKAKQTIECGSDFKLKASTVTVEASTSIKLKVGGSSVEISSSSIKLSSGGSSLEVGSGGFKVTTGAQAKFTAGGGFKVVSGGPADILGAQVKLTGSMIDATAPMVKCAGMVMGVTFLAQGAVVSPSYTPGAGNIL